MNPTVETSVIAFPKLYQHHDKGEISLSDVEHAVKLSAKELKARWLRDSIPSWDVSERTKIIHTAYISGVSDGAFRVLFGQQYFGGLDGADLIPSNRTISALTDKSIAAVKRANKELEDDGWVRSKRRRYLPSIRTTQIPEAVLRRIVSELSGIGSEPSGAVPDPRKLKYEPSQLPEGSSTSFLGSEIPVLPVLDAQTLPESSSTSLLEIQKAQVRATTLNEEEESNTHAHTRTREPEVVSIKTCPISESQFDAFNLAYSEWGLRPGALEIQPWSKSPRSITDPNLIGYVSAHSDKPPHIVSQALFESLTYMADKRTDELQRDGGGGRGKAGFGSYFAKTFRSRVTELMLAEKESAAKSALIDEKSRLAIEAETAIAAMKPKAFADRVEIGHRAAAARVASGTTVNGFNAPKDEARFDENSPKVAVVKQSWITGEQANQVIERVPGANAKQVKEALAEADRKPDSFFYSRGFGGSGSSKISISRVIDWCVTRLEAKIIGDNIGTVGQC